MITNENYPNNQRVVRLEGIPVGCTEEAIRALYAGKCNALINR